MGVSDQLGLSREQVCMLTTYALSIYFCWMVLTSNHPTFYSLFKARQHVMGVSIMTQLFMSNPTPSIQETVKWLHLTWGSNHNPSNNEASLYSQTRSVTSFNQFLAKVTHQLIPKLLTPLPPTWVQKTNGNYILQNKTLLAYFFKKINLIYHYFAIMVAVCLLFHHGHDVPVFCYKYCIFSYLGNFCNFLLFSFYFVNHRTALFYLF